MDIIFYPILINKGIKWRSTVTNALRQRAIFIEKGRLSLEILALVFGIAYALGSIPFGLLLTKMAGGGDIRSIGSGNIGATNVLRTGRKGLAALTLLLDLAKGFAAVALASVIMPAGQWAPFAPMAAAVGAVAGHCFSVFLKFDGGKGVATFAGVAFGLSPFLGGIYAVIWIGVLLLTRISALGGLCAAAAMPVTALVMQRWDWAIVLAFIALLIAWKHSANIQRLRAGTEPRIGAKTE